MLVGECLEYFVTERIKLTKLIAEIWEDHLKEIIKVNNKK